MLEQKAEELDELKARQTSLEERWKRLEEREAAVEQMMKNVQATKPAPQHSIRAKSEGSPSSFDPQAFDSTERNPGVRHYGVKATFVSILLCLRDRSAPQKRLTLLSVPNTHTQL